MRKIYAKYRLLFIAALFLSMLMASCKKDHNTPTPIPAPAPLATLGLYEVDSSIYKRAFITISQIGTKKVTYYSVFDTGSAGMTIDANGILPTSMITGSGITVAGDSDSCKRDHRYLATSGNSLWRCAERNTGIW